MIEEHDFKQMLRDVLRDGDMPTELRQVAEELQVQLATPGEWDQAQYEPPDEPPEYFPT